MELVYDIVEVTFTLFADGILQERFTRRGIQDPETAIKICEDLNKNIKKLDVPNRIVYTIYSR